MIGRSVDKTIYASLGIFAATISMLRETKLAIQLWQKLTRLWGTKFMDHTKSISFFAILLKDVPQSDRQASQALPERWCLCPSAVQDVTCRSAAK
jgi:hypothetical protein